MDYQHDEFDDVPENSTRRGAYRAVVNDPTKSDKKTLAIIITGLLALIVGAVMFVISPRLSAPTGSSSHTVASAPISAQPTATLNATAAKTGIIYNGGAFQGAAGQVATTLGGQGYTISETANWPGNPINSSIVYYAPGNAKEAESIAKTIGVGYIQQDATLTEGFTVVLAADYAGVTQASSSDTVYDLTSAAGASATATARH